jgi:sugar/nucleoside kinase (ribokinase family)
LTSNSTPANARPAKVLCLGIAVQDFVMRVAQFPAPGMKAAAEEMLVISGGCAANAAVAVARLGGRAAYAGPLGGPPGADPISDRIVADLASEGVDTAGVVRVSGATAPLSAILIDHSGERLIATHRSEKLNAARAADPAALLTGVDAVLADNRFEDFTLPILAQACERQLPIVLDADKPMNLGDPILAAATHVVFSAEALSKTTGRDDLAAALSQMSRHTAAFLAVTDGPGDMLWLAGGDIRPMPAFAIAAVDTLAAGDVFHGAFALALAEGRDAVSAMRFAAAAAAIKCTRFGGIGGAPTRAEVDVFLVKRI